MPISSALGQASFGKNTECQPCCERHQATRTPCRLARCHRLANSAQTKTYNTLWEVYSALDAKDKTYDDSKIIWRATREISCEWLTIQQHWQNTLVTSNHRLSHSLSSHIDAKVPQQDVWCNEMTSDSSIDVTDEQLHHAEVPKDRVCGAWFESNYVIAQELCMKVWQHDASYCSYIAKHSGSLMKKAEDWLYIWSHWQQIILEDCYTALQGSRNNDDNDSAADSWMALLCVTLHNSFTIHSLQGFQHTIRYYMYI